jgi:hypothetical protein
MGEWKQKQEETITSARLSDAPCIQSNRPRTTALKCRTLSCFCYAPELRQGRLAAPARSGTSRRSRGFHYDRNGVAQNCTGPPVAQFLSCKKYFELSLAILFDFFYRGDMMRQLLGRACCLECDFGGENTFGSSVLGPVTVVAGEPARGSPEVRTARRKPLNSWPRELLPGAPGYGWGALSAEAETISVSGPGVKSRCYANFVPGEPN